MNLRSHCHSLQEMSIGDNIDKDVKPCEMQIEHPIKILKFLQLLRGIKYTRINASHLDDKPCIPDYASDKLLPTKDVIQSNFGVHIARTLRRSSFFKFASGMERHNKHKYN